MKRRSWIPWCISVACSVLITLAVLSTRDYPELPDHLARLSALCDAFFVPGALYLCLCGLVFAANDGIFDVIGFSWMKFKRLFRRNPDPEGAGTFYDYRMMKHGGKKRSMKHILIPGCCDILIAVVFMLRTLG